MSTWNILKSVLDRRAVTVRPLIKEVLSKPELLMSDEQACFTFVKKALPSGHTPSEALLMDFARDTEDARGAEALIADARRYTVKDARALWPVVREERENAHLAANLSNVARQVRKAGWSEEIDKGLREVRGKASSAQQPPPLSFDFCPDVKTRYQDRKTSLKGLSSCIQLVDQKAGLMAPGSLNTIMGFSGQFKTTHAVNIAYRNAFEHQNNIAFVSLEMAREDLEWSFLSRHSLEPKFDKYEFIPHDAMRNGTLTPEQEGYLFDVIAPDFDRYGKGVSGTDPYKGKIFILDRTDFASLAPDDLYATMERLDIQCQQQTGFPIDAWIWDHLQMFKFGGTVDKNKNEYQVLNGYANQLMQWALDFRGRKTTQIMLAQVSREGFKKAIRAKGAYDLTALAEVNEAERASTRVYALYSDEALKAASEVKVQVLKSRFGAPSEFPFGTTVKPECAQIGDGHFPTALNSMIDGGYQSMTNNYEALLGDVTSSAEGLW
jgi:hypothetical protein